MKRKQLRRLVRKAAMKLDKKVEFWWTDENISLNNLDMRFNYFCVLGQLYGSYLSYWKSDQWKLKKLKEAFAAQDYSDKRNLQHHMMWVEEILKRRLKND